MKCPGQDMQYWKPGAIFEVDCPACGRKVEFFKDDTTRKCGHCGHRFLNPKMDFGCASYCQYAEQCLGDLPPELLAQKEDLLKDRVAIEVKRHFQRDFKRIGQAMRTARYAEQIGRLEKGNLAVILVSAYLLGVVRVEDDDRAKEGAPVGWEAARSILVKLGAPAPLVVEVSAVIAPKDGAGAENINAQAVQDADRIAAWEERQKNDGIDAAALERLVEQQIKTVGGRQVARGVLLQP